MTQTLPIRPVSDDDWTAITAIFNHYVGQSFAAYPDQSVDESFFRERREAHPEYPFVVSEDEGRLTGFAYLSPFHPVSTMRHTASLTYFLDPACTGRGLGTAFLEHLFEKGREIGITNFLAHISSLNPGSIRFHVRHGFHECGRFANVGLKMGERFDMVWLQRTLP